MKLLRMHDFCESLGYFLSKVQFLHISFSLLWQCKECLNALCRSCFHSAPSQCGVTFHHSGYLFLWYTSYIFNFNFDSSQKSCVLLFNSITQLTQRAKGTIEEMFRWEKDGIWRQSMEWGQGRLTLRMFKKTINMYYFIKYGCIHIYIYTQTHNFSHKRI